MSLLITPRGAPVAPQAIVQRLRAVDPRLSMKWLDSGDGCWAVMLQWSDVDRRREMVRKGEVTEEDARDVVCYLPKDCSVDQAYGYFEKACYRGNGGTSDQEVKSLIRTVHEWNNAQHQRNAEATKEYAAEIAPVFAPSIAEETGHKHIRVSQREPGKRKHLLPKGREAGEL